MLLLATLVTGAGCGLHLHREADAKQARAATDGFNKLALDGIITTARANVAALSAGELETREKLGRTLVRRDLLSVLAFKPEAGSALAPVGWAKLVRETSDVMARYGNPTGAQVGSIVRRDESLENLALERKIHASMVKTNEVIGKSPALPTACDRRVTLQPAGIGEMQWRHYQDNIIPACDRIRSATEEVDAIDALLARDPDMAAVVSGIKRLEDELTKTEGRAKELAEQYAKAKKDLADAAARRAKGDVAKAVKALEDVTDAAKDIGILDAAIKSDLLGEVVANTKSLSGDTKAPAHEVTRTFTRLLGRSPDIATRLTAAGTPTANVFLLELALQRLRYQRLAGERTAMQDLLALYRAKRALMIESAVAWARLRQQTTSGTDRAEVRARLDTEPVTEVLSSPRGKDVAWVREALLGYVVARLIEDVDLPAFDGRLADRHYRMSLDFSEVALQARDDLIRAPLQEITTYHEGGIRSEELAQLLQALGVTAIGAGVLK